MASSSGLTTGIHFLPRFLSGTGLGADVYALLLLVLAVALLFAGSSLIKVLAFLVVGLAGAAFGAAVGTLLLPILGTIVGAVVGFIIGGVIGLLLVYVGVGLALGYFGYHATLDYTHILVLAVVVGIALLIVGIVITTKVLELATAVLGGVILYGVLTFFGLAPLLSLVIAIVAVVLGFAVQFSGKQRRSRYQGRYTTTV